MKNGYELILEDEVEVGTDKGGYNGMTLGFTFRSIMSKILVI